MGSERKKPKENHTIPIYIFDLIVILDLLHDEHLSFHISTSN